MSGISITPFNPVIGARVEGVSLSGQPAVEQLNLIQSALSEHLVLVFPDQNLDISGLADFTAHFGPIFMHHADDGVIYSDDSGKVLDMVKEADGARLFGGSDWHADVTFRNPEGFVSVLHAKELPPSGGDTLFSSTLAAYQTLSSGMQSMLAKLQGVHSYNGRGRPDHETETAVHPVVRAHPVRNQHGLYINRMFVTRFDGMSSEESEPLIDFLDQHMSRPEFTCRVSWEPGQVVMWDNRFTLHYPINDFTGHRRHLIRCTAMCAG
ncbi:MAG: TauD/TfdA family dioxygenase [Acidiferrobacterales bacterium]|nr:TauD/TfdA family dioxygenase [Acidiferrobacterales bacterium]